MSNIRRYTFQVHTAHESTRNYRKFFPVLKHISADGKLLYNYYIFIFYFEIFRDISRYFRH